MAKTLFEVGGAASASLACLESSIFSVTSKESGVFSRGRRELESEYCILQTIYHSVTTPFFCLAVLVVRKEPCKVERQAKS